MFRISKPGAGLGYLVNRLCIQTGAYGIFRALMYHVEPNKLYMQERGARYWQS